MNALQLPFTFDAELILEEINQFKKEDYYEIYNPSVLQETLWSKHLIEPIGTPDQAPTFHPNEALKKCPYLLSILDSFQCNKETFRIHTLAAKANIKTHRYALLKFLIFYYNSFIITINIKATFFK